ncbi:unnamed protein product, partial [Hymenolepis diminuta]
IAQRTSTSNVEALLECRNASKDDEERTACITSFWDMVSLPEFQEVVCLGLNVLKDISEHFLVDAFFFH